MTRWLIDGIAGYGLKHPLYSSFVLLLGLFFFCYYDA